MKKLTSLVFLLAAILALTACSGINSAGDPATGGTASSVPDSSADPDEAQPAQPSAVRGTVSHAGAEKTYELTAEETEQILAMIENGAWNADGTTDCANDCKLTINGKIYHYHSACGTLNDTGNDRCLTLADTEKESINAVLGKYVTLGPELPA